MNREFLDAIKMQSNIQTDAHSGSYELMAKSVARLANVSPEKIDVALFETQEVKSNISYWLGGATMRDTDVSNAFIENGVFGIGFGQDDITNLLTEPTKLKEYIENMPDAAKTAFKLFIQMKVYDDSLIDDIVRFLPIKRKPNRKVLPDNMEKCGRLDIGLSHEEITRLIS